MSAITARKVKVEGNKLYISTLFPNFLITRDVITEFKIGKVPSLFDEIGIELKCGKTFLITERISGFFDVAKFLRVEDAFGPLWYRDVEDGRLLEQTC